MPVNMNTTTLTEGPDARDEFIREVHRTSGLLKLIPVKQITNRGESLPILPRTTVEEVGETEVKPFTDEPISSLVAKPITLATTVAVSKQLEQDKRGLLVEVARQGASDIADGIDLRAAGTIPVAATNFGDLSGISTTLPLQTKADWFAGIAALAAKGSRPTGLFLSVAEWARLSGLTHSEGAPVFNITGSIEEGVFQGTPYATFQNEGNAPHAYLGDFVKKAVAGTVYGIEIDVNRHGVIGKGESMINLWQQNMLGIRVEGAYAFNYVDSGFVKFGTAS